MDVDPIELASTSVFLLSPFVFMFFFSKRQSRQFDKHIRFGTIVLLLFFVGFHLINAAWWGNGSTIDHSWVHLPLLLALPTYIWTTGHRLRSLKRIYADDYFVLGQALLFFVLFFIFLKVPLTRNVVFLLASYGVMAIGQEFFFRAALQPCLQQNLGDRLGILAANVFFALYHLKPNQLFHIDSWDLTSLTRWYLMGLVFGYYYWRTRNLLAVVLLHFCWNAYSIAINMKVIGE